MTIDQPYIPFSQRTGLEPIPPQLKLCEVSADLRRMIDYYISLEIDRETRSGFDRSYFDRNWERVTKDLYVLFLKNGAEEYKNSPYEWRNNFKTLTQRANIGMLFDLIEFLVRHPNVASS
jgi:hypothetical protein